MNRWIFTTLIATLVLYFSCTKNDDFITDSGAKLEFSADTLRFDTVFTELGSATRFVKVYNRHKKPIQISKIFLGKGNNSSFRLNIDGIPGNSATDIQIAADDSLYIFVEVTVDPDAPLSVSPFVIHDAILFQTNGNEQSITLEAWGQNANYIPSRFGAGGIAGFSMCDFGDVVWDDPKPYVIYGILFIDECTLTIPEGTKVYVHGGLAAFEDDQGERFNYNDGRIFVGPRGKLKILGTKENPVIIQGDRLEKEFEDIPAQWFGILFSETSEANRIEYATIKNSIIGVFVDSLAELTLKNTMIYNTAGNVLTARHAKVNAENCLFHSPGRSGYCALLLHGGIYNFNYCTMASYGVDQSALGLSNFQCYDPQGQNCDVNRLSARFNNCIVFGSREDEIALADATNGSDPFTFSVKFNNSIVRLEKAIEKAPYTDFFGEECTNCIAGNRETVLFVDVDENDYHLDSLSVAKGFAKPLNNINIDLEGNERDADTPDSGCYEYFIK